MIRAALLLLVHSTALNLALSTPAAAEPLRITAAHNVLARFAEAIGGADVSVSMPVPEGRDPALWRPSISQISEIQSSDLILLNGADYAAWAGKTSLPRARTVITARSFKDRFIETEGSITHSHGPDGEHAHAGLDPHTWLDFAQAAQQAEAIAKALARTLPGADGAALSEELRALDAGMLAIAAKLPRPIIAAHPRYAYFARAYGLEIVSLDWPKGEAPSAEALAALDAALAAHPQAKLFFWEGTPTPEGVAALSARGLTGILFDPGTEKGVNVPASWAETLRALEALAAD